MKKNKYERQSFLQIFLGYFISVSVFILLLGYLYINQQQMLIIQKTGMEMHGYLMQVHRTNSNFKKDGFSYEVVKAPNIETKLPYKVQNHYIKIFGKKMMVKVDSDIVDTKINNLKKMTISIQIILIVFFAFISWVLARKSLKPMIEAISYLDSFTKDLIHDLNTPISSILINAKMLKKDLPKEDIKKIERIELSAKSMLSLYENLDVLLDEFNLSKEEFNLSNLLDEIIERYKSIYPEIKFNFENKNISILSNQNAIKRITDNIISNSCKYSKKTNPIINIKCSNNTITIEDNGKGIKYPKKIFQRSYKENDRGYGIGMHIVHRLCNELDIKIDINSDEDVGTNIVLKLK